ncbi:GAF and ANTAR domain-containing protein [Nonomuraea harbinensis]|uniref:GAF and ANTAR domain-containing protein n=2 Tax=Nonomuraea harbinensis TaxID=1286938 RepID=A0ABW1BUA7_9ACTN
MTAEFEQPLREILTVMTHAIPGETLTSVALLGDGGPYTVAFSEPGAVALDTLQFSIGAGPCLDAIKSGEAVWSDDLVSEPRWTGPAVELAAHGVRSAYAQPLAFDGHVQGTINLYSERAGGFPAETRTAVTVTAGQAEVLFQAVLRAARLNEVITQLREALTTRAIIDQALGIVMARRQCTAPAAFDILRRSSQRRNVKVHQVAADIVEAVTGRPPLPPHFGDPPATRNPGSRPSPAD